MPVYRAELEGYPYREITAIMDTLIGTVMSSLHRGPARPGPARLREELSAYAPRELAAVSARQASSCPL
jgi:RNA polymerase sigma-70 factor (ECF subfamily)